MKKIYCSSNPEDFLEVSVSCGWAYIDTRQGVQSTEIALSPTKIRKLRKQLKRALIEIESVSRGAVEKDCDCSLCEEKKAQGEGDDWFSVGRTVKIIANTSNHEFPIGVEVRLVEEEFHESMRAEYLDGHDYWWVHKNDCEPAA